MRKATGWWAGNPDAMIGKPDRKTKKPRPLPVEAFVFGGAKRDRTADLYNAIVALSQLSYGPETQFPLPWGAAHLRFRRRAVLGASAGGPGM
ncbi:MAG: hypothetical protein RLY86_1975 [Pseudomonadota bacterium]